MQSVDSNCVNAKDEAFFKCQRRKGKAERHRERENNLVSTMNEEGPAFFPSADVYSRKNIFSWRGGQRDGQPR